MVRSNPQCKPEGPSDGTCQIRRRHSLAGVQAPSKGNQETLTMSANKLLLWMSARREGSWQQFRAAVEELHLAESDPAMATEGEDTADQAALPLYQALRLNLQRLGH